MSEVFLKGMMYTIDVNLGTQDVCAKEILGVGRPRWAQLDLMRRDFQRSARSNVAEFNVYRIHQSQRRQFVDIIVFFVSGQCRIWTVTSFVVQ